MVTSVEGVKVNSELMKELAEMYNYNVDGTKKNMENKKTQNADTDKKSVSENNPPVNSDTRGFFEKYTLKNILAEIRYRLTGK